LNWSAPVLLNFSGDRGEILIIIIEGQI